MSDFDREEQAFRAALAHHSTEAPTEVRAAASRPRRPWWVASVAAAVLLVTAVILAPIMGRGPQSRPASSVTPPQSTAWQWVSFRTLEVQAPSGWAYAVEAARPDCIPANLTGPFSTDVPAAPYIVVGVPDRPTPAVGCYRPAGPDSPNKAFGELPFALWQPYVKLAAARPNFKTADRADGQWQYRQWRLTRKTIGQVQITVLAPPQNPSLGAQVLSSVRTVDLTQLGCETGAPVMTERFVRPPGPPLPPSSQASAVVICEYLRTPGTGGLEGSRRVQGQEARALVDAIHAAPESGIGPERLPKECIDAPGGRHYGQDNKRSIVLRVFGGAANTRTPLAEAYVYYDACFGSGITDSNTSRQLTRANCQPLFARAPIGLWEASAGVADRCGLSTWPGKGPVNPGG